MDGTAIKAEMSSFIELGTAARGLIEAGPDQQERLEEVTDRVGQGEFHRALQWNWDEKMTIARCVDGRLPNGTDLLAPNAAGGTESLFVADDLTVRRYGAADGTTASGYANIVMALKSAGYAVGGHTDTHAQGEKSGCGANDKLAVIYDFIAHNGIHLQALAGSIGVQVPDETREFIVTCAAARQQFSQGSELLDILKTNTSSDFIGVLEGEHKEVVAVINGRMGTTLDRGALRDEFGSNYQAFNIDTWAFEGAARAISAREQEIQQKIAAMVFYNLATAYVLAGPGMRVVVLG